MTNRGGRIVRRAFLDLGEISDLIELMKLKSINESMEKGNPTVAPDLSIHLYADSFLASAMTKGRTKNKQWLQPPNLDYS
jgi:hypothetical protein